MPGLTLIVNPTAGGGRSRQVLPQAAAALDAAGADYEVRESASLAHAGELAAAAAAQNRVIVAVGGDGMAGALAAAASRLGSPYGIVPAGRGNDLARVLRIPPAPADAARLLAQGSPIRQVDLIGVSVPGSAEAIVAGSVYAGVPSVAGTIANGTRWVRGSAVYPLAALRALARWRPVTFAVQGAAGGQREYAGYAIVVANSAFFGAGMKVAPPAQIDDGILDLVYMRHGPKLAFVQALVKIKDGSHTSLEQVSLDRDTEITLTMGQAMPVAADGETLPFAAPLPAGTPLRIRVLPAALTVIAPSGS
jgi:diacylglycerol kinase (ATP)